jgi:transcriptional regulator with XRE-family HTH domain
MTFCNMSTDYKMKLGKSQNVFHDRNMAESNDPRHTPMARRVRILRRALGFGDRQQGLFAKRMGWSQPEASTYETGLRPVPQKRILKIHEVVPGLDPLWLSQGRMDFLPPPLRAAIEEAEKAEDAAEAQAVTDELARKRQDV